MVFKKSVNFADIFLLRVVITQQLYALQTYLLQ